MKPRNNDPLLNTIMDDLFKNYQCHTIILYGSRARGEATPTSDYDIIALREKGEMERDCRYIEGHYLDIFIYPDTITHNPDISLIRMKDGIVLCQKDSFGDDLLKKIKSLFNKGPSKTPSWEKHEINTWVMKMFDRAEQEDIEGNFRRHWLLHDLLECYFKLRDSWYLGPKESFQWLKKNDLETYMAFNEALKPNASLNEIERLISWVKKE